MGREMTEREKQIYKILQIVAYKIARNSKGKYQQDELVNEAWLRGYIFQEKHKTVYRLFSRARLDVLEYLRRRQKQSPRFDSYNRAKQNYMEHLKSNVKRELSVNEMKIVEKEIFKCLLNGMPNYCKEIALMLSKGYSQREIAEKFQKTQAWVSYEIKYAIKPQLKKNLLILGFDE
jgi:hypothetical protein